MTARACSLQNPKMNISGRKIQQNVRVVVSGKKPAGESAEVKGELWLVQKFKMAEITDDASRHVAGLHMEFGSCTSV